MKRRHFLKRLTGGVAAATLAPAVLRESAPGTPEAIPTSEYNLGIRGVANNLEMMQHALEASVIRGNICLDGHYYPIEPLSEWMTPTSRL